MIKLLNNIEKKYPQLYEIFKFIIVGGFATIIDMLTMALVLYLSSPKAYNYNFINTIISKGNPPYLIAIISTGVGFLCGLIFNYIFSIIFAFNKSDTSFAKTKKGFIVFALLSFVGFLIHTIGMAIGFGILKINEWIIKILLTFVVLFFNYITRKKIIFKKKKN